MADACFTARSTTREHVAASIKKLTLPTTDNGQYDHDAATTFIAGIHRVLRETYNPGDPGNGMFKLCAAANEIASIKATSVATAKSVLDDAKAIAAAASTGSSIVPPAIDSRADAQDEADRINLINQAVIGAKEGAAEAIATIGGNRAVASSTSIETSISSSTTSTFTLQSFPIVAPWSQAQGGQCVPGARPYLDFTRAAGITLPACLP